MPKALSADFSSAIRMQRICPSTLRLQRSTAPSDELEYRGVVSSCVSSVLAALIACAKASEAGSPSVRRQTFWSPKKSMNVVTAWTTWVAGPLSQHCTKGAPDGQCKKFNTVKMSVSPRRLKKK